MKNAWVRNGLLVAVLAGFCFAVACSHVDGTYRDTDGLVTMKLNGGKASIDVGEIHMDGAYSVSGNKLTITPTIGNTNQPLVFTIDSDGSLEAPAGSMFPKLLKQK